MAKTLQIEGQEEASLAQAVAVLARGLPVAIPTETVYGLAADATDSGAVRTIYAVKGRPSVNPLICHMSDLVMAERHADFDPLSRRLAEAFWPGPLTLVLPLRAGSPIAPEATAGLPSVGIRVPRGFAGRLIAAYGKPLAAPSANPSGRISPTTAAHVEAGLGERIELILDGGPARVGVESTIVKVEGDGTLRLLRPGGLSVDDIERVAGVPVSRGQAASAAIEAPGMLASHYAPRAAVRIGATEVRPGEAFLKFGSAAVPGEDAAVAVFALSAAGDPAEAASRLFELMKRADETGATSIAVSPIPPTGLGEAVNDRLARAAAPRPEKDEAS
ncbi:L-threonylcarbamoyladenylate synthase [Rhizobiaceae bacterium BDR2-2]|uniref:Threonylcarbamoyl-AMP synthase n=1 Tax=Ectorhizobium quercum TaxID=2965071 RepID=A0AAE3MXM1_9HYPH|nr:L-threonylcarbamoyladenylate synthase [Ectorhizobium quercum]MCX8996351.1 L-threonylcarbamoyladenylate synthase [Ectorhizobium quercum]MCX8998610.1 L-threonylcarbamoyladenylate synthase [Ectorhizobium quercum]